MRIHTSDQGFLVDAGNGKMKPGHYEDRRAATYSMEFSDELLDELFQRNNQRAITYQDLKGLEKEKS